MTTDDGRVLIHLFMADTTHEASSMSNHHNFIFTHEVHNGWLIITASASEIGAMIEHLELIVEVSL